MVAKVDRGKIHIFDVINVLIMIIVCILMIYPFIYLLIISISPISEVMKSNIILIPKKISFDSYKYVLRYAGVGSAYKVTIFITVVGTLISLIMTALGAYVLTIKDLPGRNLFLTLVIITMIFNGGLIPSYMVVKQLHMINQVWALIIPNAINTFWMIVMRNFFQSIPVSLSESARIDGCSEYKILLKIILPLSLPIIATLALFYAVSLWNTYFNAILYINSKKLQPLQVLIRSMYDQGSQGVQSDTLPPPAETIRAATIMIATLPILCIYPFLQKYFAQGIMVGAVKG